MTQVLSYGGGLQTVAMCLLVTRSVLPQPDRIVMADTGREAQSTFDYLDRYTAPHLAQHGLTVELAPHSLAHRDLYARGGDLLLPAYTRTGKLPTFCSSAWKGEVIERHLRASGVKAATNWIGFTVDEAHRVKSYGDPPWLRRYPLIDLMLSRTDCAAIVAQQGWPEPHKSACWMCPHRSNAEWRLIRDEEPEHWQAAITIDREIRDNDERGGVYLHHARVPLAEADLEADDRREPARQCALGWCMV